jgi:hypothetical protein
MRRSTEGQLMSLISLGDGSTLTLDFTTGVLDSRLTFTRASTGTFINASGNVATASNNVARFDYDPTTLAPRGLLIEGSATNLLPNSQTLSGTGWFTGGICTRTSNYATGPDGIANSATRLEMSFSGGVGRTYYDSGYTTLPQTMSVWLKSNTGSNQTVNLWNTSGTPVSCTVTPTWKRFQSVSTTGSSLPGYFYFENPSTTVAVDILAWGAQLEAGSGASSYIPTVASTVQRLADFCTIPTSSFITGPLYPQTLFAECIPANPSAAFLDIVRLFDRTAGGTFNYGTELYYYGSSTMTSQRKINASTNTDRSLASGLAYNSRHKLAVAVDSSAFLGSYDGLTGSGTTTAPSALASQVTHMGVGCSGDASPGSVMFGTIRQIKFFPFAMAQSQLNALTTL